MFVKSGDTDRFSSEVINRISALMEIRNFKMAQYL